MKPPELDNPTAAQQIALAKSPLAGDLVHLHALHDRLRHTQLIIRAAAIAYIESRWLLAQIERNNKPRQSATS